MAEERSTVPTPEYDLGRVVTFTDGVFAIAITLLVLGLSIPAGHPGELDQNLRDEHNALIAYIITFVVVGRVWIVHHQFVGALRRFDGPLIWLTLLYLSFIAVLPFTSELIGNYGSHWEASTIYAASLAGVLFSFSAGTIYAYRRDLVHVEYRPFIARRACPGSLTIAVCFLASIPIAYYANSSNIWIIWAIAAAIPARWGRHLARPLLGGSGE